MRRVFMIFLLVLMPLQLSWAALASYCQHESGVTAQHFGHHEHQHQTQADEPDQGKPKSFGMADADCGLCQAGCTTIVAAPQKIPPLSTASVSFGWPPDTLASTSLSRPERPNWAALASFGETVYSIF